MIAWIRYLKHYSEKKFTMNDKTGTPKWANDFLLLARFLVQVLGSSIISEEQEKVVVCHTHFDLVSSGVVLINEWEKIVVFARDFYGEFFFFSLLPSIVRIFCFFLFIGFARFFFSFSLSLVSFYIVILSIDCYFVFISVLHFGFECFFLSFFPLCSFFHTLKNSKAIPNKVQHGLYKHFKALND